MGLAWGSPQAPGFPPKPTGCSRVLELAGFSSYRDIGMLQTLPHLSSNVLVEGGNGLPWRSRPQSLPKSKAQGSDSHRRALHAVLTLRVALRRD